MVRNARIAYLLVAWVLVIAIVVQFVLGGQAVFQDAGRSAAHVALGYGIGVLTVFLAILAWAGQMPRFLRGSEVLIVLFVIEFALVAVRSSLPVAEDLHPLTGALILVLATYLAWRSRSMAPPPLGTCTDV